MGRELFERQLVTPPADPAGRAGDEQAEAAREGRQAAAYIPSSSLSPSPGLAGDPIAAALLGWLIVGILGAGYFSLANRAPQPVMETPVEVPSYVSPSPATEEPRPAPRPHVTGIKIAADVTAGFSSVIDSRSFAAPADVGLVVVHSGYTNSDRVRTDLYLNGRYYGRCEPMAMPTGDYWCQYRSVPAGRGEFRLNINGELNGRYYFQVEAPAGSSDAPAAVDQAEDRPPARKIGGTQNERGLQKKRRAEEQAPAQISCVMPNGQEVRMSYASCRANSGVIFN